MLTVENMALFFSFLLFCLFFKKKKQDYFLPFPFLPDFFLEESFFADFFSSRLFLQNL